MYLSLSFGEKTARTAPSPFAGRFPFSGPFHDPADGLGGFQRAGVLPVLSTSSPTRLEENGTELVWARQVAGVVAVVR